VTVTLWARAARSSLGEVLIPRSTKLNCVVLHQKLHAPNLGPPKATALGQPNRIKPEFGSIRVPFHMDVPRLVSVSGVEEQPIGSAPEDRRHEDDCMPASSARRRLVSLTLPLTRGHPTEPKAREVDRRVERHVRRPDHERIS
jgi:hypothetical protein